MRFSAAVAAVLAALLVTAAPALADARLGTTGPRSLDPHQLADRTALSVNVANGNLVVEAGDVNIAGTGLSLSLSRTYNSLNSASGELGQGWSLSGGKDVQLSGAAADGSRTLTWMDGSKHQFVSGVAPELGAHLTSRSDGGHDLTFDQSGTVFAFTPGGDLTKVTDRNGNAVSFAYGTGGLTTATDTHAKQVTVRRSTGTGTNIDQLTDWSGRTWGFGYTNDRMTSYTDPEAKRWSYAYNTAGKLSQITDPRGTVTKIAYVAYDGADRVSAVTRVVDGTATNDVTTTYAYFAPTAPCDSTKHTRKTVVTDPRGKATSHCSTASERVTLAKDALGRDQETTYTPNGDVQTFSDIPGTGSAAITQLNYDLGGSDPSNTLRSGQYGAGESFAIDYYAATSTDPLARYRAKQVTDTEGNVQAFGYDAKGNLSSVKDSASTASNQATLEYHPNGVLKSATDGEGRRTDYGQVDGNITSVTPPAPLGATTLTYDALNRVKTVKDGKGQTRTLTYDKLDRVVRVDVSDGRYFSYVFDANGNMTSRKTSPNGFQAPDETVYTYDKLNRRTYDSSGWWFEYTYDKASNLTTIGGAGATTSYAYDDVDRVKTVAQNGGIYVTYDYDDAGRKVTRSYYGGAKHETTSDKSGKPTLIAFRPPSGNTYTTARTLSYDYTQVVDGASKQRSMIQSITREDGRKSAYEYGRVGEVTKMRRTNGSGGLIRELRYTYDKALNRLSRVKEEPTGTTSTYWAYNAANQVCAQSTSPSPSCSLGTFGYDANGNRTSGPGAGTYDALDRLTKFGTSTIEHDGPTNGEISSMGASEYRNSLLGVSARATSTTTYANYVRDPDGNVLGVFGEVGAARTGQWFMTDHLGSTISQYDPSRSTDTRGVFEGDALYEPDGVTTNPAPGAFKFAGGIQVPSGVEPTGVYHYGRRFYDTNTAQWTQPDPLEQVTDLRQANRYAYVGANGVNHVDPAGTAINLWKLGKCAVAVGANLFLGAKIYRAVKAHGGVREAAELLIKAGDIDDAIKAGGYAFAQLAGVYAVKDACF